MSTQGIPMYFASREKSDAADCIMSFIKKIENLNEVRVKELRSDNGTEWQKAFRLFNIRRQEMEETYHVTFSEYDEAISESTIEGDEINFNENRSFLDDEFLVIRNKVSQYFGNDDYFPYVPTHDLLSTNNIPIPDTATPLETSIL
ncbi:hypothetical protein Tco_1525844 [Tanacetum coccineum]